MLLNLIDNQDLLVLGPMLDKGLDNSASVMLINQINEFITDQLYSFLNNLISSFISLLELLLLHQQFIIIDSEFLNQI